MTESDAIELLSYHSGVNPDIDNPKWKTGFLGMLRPYQGHLIEENFHEVIACIRTLAPVLQDGETLPRNVVGPIWGICQLGRVWGVDPGGMLRRNDLISDADIERLDTWLDTISYATWGLIDGMDEVTAFEFYTPMKVYADAKGR